jgi:hypothetical protein
LSDQRRGLCVQKDQVSETDSFGATKAQPLVLEIDDGIASDVLEMQLRHAGPIPSRPRSMTSHRRQQVRPLHTEWVVDASSSARQGVNIPFARFVMKCRDCGDGPTDSNSL